MCVFWHSGYEATSLDDLTKAMGLSRSSFYGTFGSKQALFLRALEHYSGNALRGLKEIAENAGDSAIDEMMEALSDPEGSPRGCLLVNCITELAPHDDKVAEIGRRHLERIEEVIAGVLDPENSEAARPKARAYCSLALGTLTLRKSGIPADRIRETLKQAASILST